MEDAVPPWQEYVERKQLLRKRLRCSYVKLIAFTLLFGFLTIGLRLKNLSELRWFFGETRSTENRELEMLVGQQLSDGQLADRWGESRVLVGSNEELELRYFAQAKVYLLRRHEYVVYAGTRSP